MRPFCEPSPKSLTRAAEMVRGVDTNVLARWLMRDDHAQMRIADEVMAGPIEISHTVLVEIGWVLTSAGRMSRQQFAHVVSVVLALRNASIEKRQELRWAVERYRAGADWADLVHLVSLP